MRDKMKIMQIAPHVLPVGPYLKYGGIERVIRDLDSEYVREGHESLVVAAANSEIDGRLIPSISHSAWKSSGSDARYNVNAEEANDSFERHCEVCLDAIEREKPDAIHDHTKFVTSKAYAGSGLSKPVLTTFHGDLDDRSISAIGKINDIRKDGINFFNAISESQRNIFSPVLDLDFVVYNAIRVEDYPYSEEKRGYFFSIGKMDRNKGQDTAIRTAKDLGKKLVIAGPVHEFRSRIKQFWEADVKPHIDVFRYDIPPEEIDGLTKEIRGSDKSIFYVGEVNDSQKMEWYKYADAFLMPIRWSEPFGLVMIEAMVHGTPVVAYGRGAVPEIVKTGENGFVVKPDNYEDFVEASSRVGEIDPMDCRKYIEERFDISRQARDYVNIFREIKVA
jgi:glycosyltransferase involved in cell wall biosynthesis